jgi:hypothetical protein
MKELEEIPKSSTFSFSCKTGGTYNLICQKAEIGFKLWIFLDGVMQTHYKIAWNIPPDYEAAKELIENFINKKQ